MKDQRGLREIGKKNVTGIEIKTLFPGCQGKDPDLQVEDQDPLRVEEDHVLDQDLPQEGELEQLQDTMFLFQKFLYDFPPVM